MSKDLILKIKDTEAEAAKIRADAAEQAKERIRRAEAEAARFCEASEKEAERENAAKIRLTREKADELLAARTEAAKQEAEAIRAAASPYRREAVRLVVEGYIMRNAGLEEAQAGIKIAGRNTNNRRYADDTTLMAESEEELKAS